MKTLLFPIILISLIILLTASFYSFKKEITTSTDIACKNDIECKIVADKTTSGNNLVLETSNNTRLYPELESNNLILVENSRVRVCYTSIDSTNSTHKTIFINKVVFLP